MHKWIGGIEALFLEYLPRLGEEIERRDNFPEVL
jgi:hypothetical protein